MWDTRDVSVACSEEVIDISPGEILLLLTFGYQDREGCCEFHSSHS